MRSLISGVLESFVNNQREGFNSNYGGNPSNNKTNVWILIISFILVEILILIFGKYLWNKIAIKIIPGLKPILSIWEILGLSILIKLLTN